ncbi:bifunctional folylpolyglutamate synthase/dihydrofolate synthase [Flavobacterium jejuense]|uniref:Dihydrofolate synthase/folylpolyglutamate synthase n=1 Tax=Flavobacterium jejuense TaxID=1544455 RepID=A0ABX0IUA5_9FLAO|nr:Mur ligase family protein [Flavobacterium jejuense]NHN27293.1 bifunctional folylpolyglutamate synthase/dihydrofolate synthase [Flavobacterium jejuense]
MTYEETTSWLFKQLPMFQQQGAIAYKNDLSNTISLVNYLGNPENKFKSVHVAGTNGKGSSSSLLASVLQEAGYKVGLYTSPHLKDYRERIRINGNKISKAFVVEFVVKHKSFFESHNLSFFEMTVGLAFDYFAKEEVDVAIIEVGMGGRLDATNVITPLVSLITNIGFDHTRFLGNTLEAIAFEKAGIVKNNVPVVISEYLPETKPVFLNRALKVGTEVYFAQDLDLPDLASTLLGEYQKANKKGVLQTLAFLKKNFIIPTKAVKEGFLNVIENTGLLGRWQILGSQPKIVCDTAHNADGLAIVINQIKKEKFENLHIVLGVVSDKDLDAILSLFPRNANYYFCKPNLERGLNAVTLKQKANDFGLKGLVFNSVSEAYKEAQKVATTNDFIYIGGSTFVVAEIV